MTMTLALRLLEGGPALIQRAADQTLLVEVGSEQTREREAISAGTVTLYDTARVALVTAGSLTPSSTIPGRASYSLSASAVPASLPLGRGYRLVWSLTVAGTAYVLERDAALCRQVPSPTVTAEDLYARHPDLAEQTWDRQVATRWQPQIDSAWRAIVQRLDSRGRRHELVWSRGSLHDAHLALTLALIYQGMVTRMQDGSRYERLAEQYRAAYDAAWTELVFDYDPDDTATRGLTQSGEAMLSTHLGPRGGIRGGAWGMGWRR